VGNTTKAEQYIRWRTSQCRDLKKFWPNKESTLKSEYPALVNKYPDSDALIKQVHRVLCDTEYLARYTPPSVGDSSDWASVVDSAEENRANYCKALLGKTLFSALYGTYTVTLNALKAILKASTQPGQNNAPTSVHQQSTKDDGFQEVRRRKRQCSEESAKVSKKPTVPATTPAL
jgi:hypothetical protein